MGETAAHGSDAGTRAGGRRLRRMPSHSAPRPDIKPRSRQVTDGLEATASRGMLRAVGFSDEDFAKAQVAVASSWNEITPCNYHSTGSQAVKEGVHAAGGFPMEFTTIAICDGIAMGHEGMNFSLMSREVIADSVEPVMQAERLDGPVVLAGCDKSLPGMLMAMARLDLPRSSSTPARSCRAKLPDGERDVTIIDVFEAVGSHAGLMIREDVDAIERAICPGEGACGGMYTANTMASVGEAIGMSLPGAAAPPAVDRRRDGSRAAAARPSSACCERGITARHHDPGGVRERDRRRDGARRLHQRRAAPARHRARGRRRPDARRLRPDRRARCRTSSTSSRSGAT